MRSAPVIDGYPTAAVEQFTRGRVSRAALAAELLNRFEEWYLKRSLTELVVGVRAPDFVCAERSLSSESDNEVVILSAFRSLI